VDPSSYRCIIFFFSSSRRHTRFSRDWSSDVCSSDLCCDLIVAANDARIGFPEVHLGAFPALGGPLRLARRIGVGRAMEMMLDGQIGRASCRERVKVRKISLALIAESSSRPRWRWQIS